MIWGSRPAPPVLRANEGRLETRHFCSEHFLFRRFSGFQGRNWAQIRPLKKGGEEGKPRALASALTFRADFDGFVNCVTRSFNVGEYSGSGLGLP